MEVAQEVLVETETTVNISNEYNMEGARDTAVPLFYQTNYQKTARGLWPLLMNHIIEVRSISHLLNDSKYRLSILNINGVSKMKCYIIF